MKRVTLGIDVGGTNIAFGIVDREGNVLSKSSIATPQCSDAVQYTKLISSEIQAIISKADDCEICGIGIGAPNGNYYKGTIEYAANLTIKGIVPFIQLLKEQLNCTYNISLTNDANAAAMGEMTYGVARGMKNFIMITLGTGVGSGIVVNGQVVYGSDGFAGELGHVIIDRSPEARQCGCGRKGCLEAYCSATGIVRTAREMLIKDARPSKLRSLNPDDITGLDVSVAAKDGDELAIDILRYTGRLLGQACANFALFCSPEAFVFFGGPTKSGELLMKHVREAYDEDILYVYKGKAKILLSGLNGSDAAVLGASALGWEL